MPGAALGAVILAFECDAGAVAGKEAAVGDGDAVGVARQIGQHGLGAAEGAFAVNHPFDPARWRQIFSEGDTVREFGVRAKELQAPGGMGGDELFQKQPSEQPREHAHRQEEARPAGHPALTVQGNTTARNDHVNVRMMGERRTPCVQHGSHADPRAQAFGIGGDRDHRLGGGLEQKVVNHGLVLVGDVANRRRQGEDHVVIWGGQQLGLALSQPSPRRRALALRAMPIAAANGRRPLAALWANPVMESWRRLDHAFGSAAANPTHH